MKSFSSLVRRLLNNLEKNSINTENILVYKKLQKIENLTNETEKIIDPHKLQNDILEYYHNVSTSHQGLDKTFAAIKNLFWWTTMKQDLKEYIESCDTCQQISQVH